MKIKYFLAVSILALNCMLPGCGGGGGGGGNSQSYTVGGTVSGLSGAGLVLQNNGGDDLSISGNGPFAFTTKLADGAEYNVSVKTHPPGPLQTCSASSNTGTVSGRNITNISIVCSTNSYTVGGIVSGLTGTGLVLQNNGGDDLPIAADGPFTFTTELADGAEYNVSVKTHPTGPLQTCSASSNTGTASGGNITNISIACSTNSYTVGGIVSGLAGTGLVLQNNSGNDLSISSNGVFTFTAPVADTAGYSVTVKTNPTSPTQTCTASNNSGSVSGSNVTEVSIVCATNTYSVGGTVSGLAGSGLILQNNNGNNLSITANGSFTFTNQLADGSGYSVKVKTAPIGPAQACVVTSGSGTISGSNVTNIAVACKDPDVVNGTVKAIAVAPDGTTYIGGKFTEVGPSTGAWAPISATTAQPAGNFPKVVGTVYAVAPDWYGGWYIGGEFTHVGGVSRNRLTHVLADGSVDLSWNPNANGTVYALAVINGSRIYAGGAFTSIGGITQNYLAIINASGKLESCPSANGRVRALSMAETGPLVVYVGGDFTIIGTKARNHLGAISDAGVLTSWNPGANGTVHALFWYGNVVYAGGAFTQIGTTERQKLAAINTDGTLASWNPGVVGGPVYALTAIGNTIYVGGDFFQIGNYARLNIGAVSVDGNVLNWSPTANQSVSALSANANGSVVYAGGYFTQINNTPRNYLAAINASDGSLTSWDPHLNDPVYVLFDNVTTVYAGGEFTMMGGTTRNNLAAFNPDGTLSAWNPNANGDIYALALNGNLVYAGGAFTSIGTTARNHLAAINADGSLSGWNPAALGDVLALRVSGGIVYAGGDFLVVSGATRNRLAAINTDGSLASWNPSANDTVSSLVVSGKVIYAGGGFTTINGTTRNRLAAINIDGSLAAWNPDANGDVDALAVSGSTVYVGGGFTTIGGKTGTARNHLAAINTDGTLSAWNPNADGYSVYGLAVSTNLIGTGTVYAGGWFNSIGGQTRQDLASISTTGTVGSWNPNPNGRVYALSVVSGAIYVGGEFTRIGSELQGGFARLSR